MVKSRRKSYRKYLIPLALAGILGGAYYYNERKQDQIMLDKILKKHNDDLSYFIEHQKKP